MGLLLKLELLRPLLEPFFNKNKFLEGKQDFKLSDLKAHFIVCGVKESPQQRGEPICIMLENLKNINANFAEFADYFVENSSTGKITRFIPRYMKDGHFISSLSASGQASLTFQYSNNRFVIDSFALEENANWAKILCESSMQTREEDKSILRIFVDSFNISMEVHKMRLLLEDSGHPDFQSSEPTSLSAEHLNANGIPIHQNRDIIAEASALLQNLAKDLKAWEFEINQNTKQCPRYQ
jgi:hypothetical protein